MSTRVPVMPPTSRPLEGRRILLTRARQDNEPLRNRLELLGATVVEMPTIEILPPEDLGPLETALQALDRYQWVCFTSRNAVRAVGEMLERAAVPLPASLRVGAVGPSTSRELTERGIHVDCMPETSTGDALVEAMLLAGAGGTRVLLPQGNRARPAVSEGLLAGGASVDTVIAYRTEHPGGHGASPLPIQPGPIDVVVLTSPSALHGLLDMVGDNWAVAAKTRLACIGPTTARAVADAGLVPDAVAPDRSLEGLVRAVQICLEKEG